MSVEALPGWEVEGPHFKSADRYLDADGDNPQAPWPGYGWPLGTECYWFRLRGHGKRLAATGLTVEDAEARASLLMGEHSGEPSLSGRTVGA